MLNGFCISRSLTNNKESGYLHGLINIWALAQIVKNGIARHFCQGSLWKGLRENDLHLIEHTDTRRTFGKLTTIRHTHKRVGSLKIIVLVESWLASIVNGIKLTSNWATWWASWLFCCTTSISWLDNCIFSMWLLARAISQAFLRATASSRRFQAARTISSGVLPSLSRSDFKVAHNSSRAHNFRWSSVCSALSFSFCSFERRNSSLIRAKSRLSCSCFWPSPIIVWQLLQGFWDGFK